VRITAVVIMRNEAVLIAAKLAACSVWADEIVVIDQKSEDGSSFIAREALALIGDEHRVVPMRGDVLGKEFSFAQGFEAASGDWVVYTDVDEVLVAPQGFATALAAVPDACAAPGILRWHAIANGDAYFKVERFDEKRFRLLRKPGARVFEPETRRYKDLLHKREPVDPAALEPHYSIPREQAFLMEFKTPYQHYADQLFYEAVGSRNDRAACEERFGPGDLEIGRALFEGGHAEHRPRTRWRWPWS
jgi:glycosyltransferase involved in cell wall biosynthesis